MQKACNFLHADIEDIYLDQVGNLRNYLRGANAKCSLVAMQKTCNFLHADMH